MIGSIKGVIKLLRNKWAVVETNGIGFKVYLPLELLMKKKIGDEIALYTYMHFTENSFDIYGFEAIEELDLFELLLTVPGLGPKIALNIINQAKPSQIKQAIIKENKGFFIQIPGVGKKTAERLIVELKGKVGLEITEEADHLDVFEALLGLGYKPYEIKKVLSEMPKNLQKADEKIKWALKRM